MKREVVGYCTKCKLKRVIADAHEMAMKGGMPVVEGRCPVCQFRMINFAPPIVPQGKGNSHE